MYYFHYPYTKQEIIKLRIKERRRLMGISEVTIKAPWCWHKWLFIAMNFTLGDCFECQKCGKRKYKNYY